MKNLGLTLVALLSGMMTFGQILITDADMDTANHFPCGSYSVGDINFFDSGNNTGNYAASENEEITLCPDGGGSKMSFAIDLALPGYVWDVDSTDTLKIFDGMDTNADLLLAMNTNSHPTGGVATATFANQSGCLTIQFVSNADAQVGAGWDADVFCTNPPQPIEMHMEAYVSGTSNAGQTAGGDLIPADTGYVDVCFGDSILFVATPQFPYEPGGSGATWSGGGYQQTDSVNYQWVFSDGTISTNDSVWFTPPAVSGYLCRLSVQDNFPQNEVIMSRIRVSTVPAFGTSVGLLDDTVCLGVDAYLLNPDLDNPNSGLTVGPTTGMIEAGGNVAGEIPLPDGTGPAYTSTILVMEFGNNDTVYSGANIQGICVDIEHTYMNDLEMWITCPNGQEAILFNAYDAGGSGVGQFPGGFNVGSMNLGDAVYGAGTGGECWTYCFYDTAANDSWANLAPGIPTVPGVLDPASQSVTPGNYKPETPYSTLIGCPLNGIWTLSIKDSWLGDEGVTCGWSISFQDSLGSLAEAYEPDLVWGDWASHPHIIGDSLGSTILLYTDSVGEENFTYTLIDSYGCWHDTTVTLVVAPGVSIDILDTISCNGADLPVTGVTNSTGGFWWGDPEITFSPNDSALNPTLSATGDGFYNVYFYDTWCQDTLDQLVIFTSDPQVTLNPETAVICQGDQIPISASMTYASSFSWDNGATEDTISVTEGSYTITVDGVCGTVTATAEITAEECEMPNVITPNGDGNNEYFLTSVVNYNDDVHLQIFNRLGRLVWESTSYQNDWNGVNQKGKKLADGVYFYTITWDEGRQDGNGHVTILNGGK